MNEPRDRFVKYYQDLHELYKVNLNRESIYEGGQFTFSQIGEKLLEEIPHFFCIQDLDILIPTFWSYEFDPDYSNCGAYLLEKFNLTCDLFDIYEQGTLSAFSGLHILKQYLSKPDFNSGLMLALEQTTIPRDYYSYPVLPTHDGGCALLLQSNPKKDFTLKVVDLMFFDFSHLTTGDFKMHFIVDWLNGKKDVCIVLKKISFISKLIQKAICAEDPFFSFFDFDYIPSEPSLLSVFHYLANILENKKCKARYILIMEEDVETLNVGVLLLEVIKDSQA